MPRVRTLRQGRTGLNLGTPLRPVWFLKIITGLKSVPRLPSPAHTSINGSKITNTMRAPNNTSTPNHTPASVNLKPHRQKKTIQHPSPAHPTQKDKMKTMHHRQRIDNNTLTLTAKLWFNTRWLDGDRVFVSRYLSSPPCQKSQESNSLLTVFANTKTCFKFVLKYSVYNSIQNAEFRLYVF